MDIIALRRDFHMHPEVGFTEFRTASKVVEILSSLGYEVIYGPDAMDGASRRGFLRKRRWRKPTAGRSGMGPTRTLPGK
ncbi:hypothetical protein LJK88_35880 [Paenibacillus sp. P26]|nr:hypothetical protein LJK88_35880 [Paenibacillus sp. P26]